MMKWAVYYRENGQTWTVQVDTMCDGMTQEDFNLRPEYKYFLETESGLQECDKDKNILAKKEKVS